MDHLISNTPVFLCVFLATDLLLAWNPVCMGLVEGVIGKIQLHTGRWRMKTISAVFGVSLLHRADKFWPVFFHVCIAGVWYVCNW